MKANSSSLNTTTVRKQLEKLVKTFECKLFGAGTCALWSAWKQINERLWNTAEEYKRTLPGAWIAGKMMQGRMGLGREF